MPVPYCGYRESITLMRLDVVGHDKDGHTFSFVVPPAGTAVQSCSW